MQEIGETTDSYTGKMDLKAAFIGSSPNDPCLFKELGIEIDTIKFECLLPLKVFQKAPFLPKVSDDLTGPIIILCFFTLSLILQGKIHFGYIYLISLMSSFTVFILLTLMSTKSIRYLVCCNIMGYSFTPITTFSFINLISKWVGINIRIILGAVASFWSAYTASKVFCVHMEFIDRQAIVLYPLFLTYCCFVMMILF